MPLSEASRPTDFGRYPRGAAPAHEATRVPTACGPVRPFAQRHQTHDSPIPASQLGVFDNHIGSC